MKLLVKIKPGEREEKVEKVDKAEGSVHKADYVVWTKALPIEGRANMAMLRALARHFGVSSVQVRLVSGHASRLKLVEILEHYDH